MYDRVKFKFHCVSVSVDHTRVKLIDVDPHVPGAEYINANYIKVTYTGVVSAVIYYL
jgi:protein tyrosine phosphatase